jgi:hypothetical protein
MKNESRSDSAEAGMFGGRKKNFLKMFGQKKFHKAAFGGLKI